MKNKIINTIIVGIALISISIPNINTINAETKNVVQERRVAEIEEFPASYQPGLKHVKSVYPNAEFIYYDTNLDWYEDLLSPENEMKDERNLVEHFLNEDWKSKDPKYYSEHKETFTAVEPGWYQASQMAIEYQMDPRNFLSPDEIFQFLQFSYSEDQTEESMKPAFESTFMAGSDLEDLDGNKVSYGQALHDIGKKYKISPYLLLCRIKQEQYGGNSKMVSGYEGHYNLMNINATGSTYMEILNNGISYAKEQGWDTKYKSIEGGAKFLKERYMDSGKDCLYLHHFNVVANQDGVVDYLPYMTALQAPQSEGKTLKQLCRDKENKYTFIIPVYKNMPKHFASRPNDFYYDDYLLDDISLNNGDISFGTFSSDEYRYDTTVGGDVDNITVTVKSKRNETRVFCNEEEIKMESCSGSFDVPIKDGENEIRVLSIAHNGLRMEYVIGIHKDNHTIQYRSDELDISKTTTIIEDNMNAKYILSKIKTANCDAIILDINEQEKEAETLCASGDILVIKDKKGSEIYRTYLRVNGDIDMNGIVNEEDSVALINDMLENSALPWQSRMAADVNNDGKINAVDVGLIQKTINKALHQEVKTNKKIDFDLIVPENVLSGRPDEIRIQTIEGPYCVTGHIKYDEGKLTTNNQNNSGKIRFIINEGRVYFENKKDFLELTTLVENEPVHLECEFNQMYNYETEQLINVDKIEKEIAPTVPSELLIELTQTEQNTLHLKLTNQAEKSITKINMDFGSYIVNKDGEASQSVVGIMKGKYYECDLKIPDSVAVGKYETSIAISYYTTDYVNWLTTIPVNFVIGGHSHEQLNWRANEDFHSAQCPQCKKYIQEEHKMYQSGPKTWKCAKCDYTETINVRMNRQKIDANDRFALTPTIYSNDQAISSDRYEIEWIIDGESVYKGNSYNCQIDEIGIHTLDLILKRNGEVMVFTFPLTVKEASLGNIKSTTCDSINTIQASKRLYKVDDGEWENTTQFSGLSEGRHKLTAKNTMNGQEKEFSIYLGHQYEIINEKHLCGEDLQITKKCSVCGKEIVETIENSKREHCMIEYKIIEQPTTKHGTKMESECAYGCGYKETKELDDKLQHSFTHYIDDNNGSCVVAGTKTAYCDCGCGAKHTIPNKDVKLGHEYIYKRDNNATYEKSMTETGVCKRCGAVNVRKVYDTKLQYLGKIETEISAARSGEKYLPKVKVKTHGVEIANIKWIDSDGKEFDNTEVSPDEIYTIKNIIFRNTGSNILDQNTILFVNGQRFKKKGVTIDNGLVFENVGRFDFKKS